MLLLLAKYLFRRRKTSTASQEAVEASLAYSTPATPDWQRELTQSMRQNCVAPSEDTVLHTYDLYCEQRYASFQQRHHEMSTLFADIVAAVTDVHALTPHLIERAMSRHPFEFSHILEDKETR